MAPKTAEELSQFVLPLFVPDDRHERPDRAGSCVLVRVFDRHFVVTARHVFGSLDRQTFFLGRQGARLIEFTVPGIYTVNGPPEDDVAVIPLSDTQLSRMTGLAFITEQFVEGEGDPPPFPGDEYIVFGFPDSNSQFKPDRRLKDIKQNSFYFQTVAKPPEVAARVGCSLESHMFLKFDPEDISV